MAVKTILVLALFACFAALVLSYPSVDSVMVAVHPDDMENEINSIREAIQEDAGIGMQEHGRLFFNRQNLSQLIIAANTSAVQSGSATFSFIPLSVILGLTG